MTDTFPERAQVVIVGAGIAGASIAYHLALLGMRDVVVLEQGELTCGTTSHAPGLVGQLRSSATLSRMLMYSVSLYRQLSLDGMSGFQPVGSLRLASSRERFRELQRQEGFARAVGLEAHLVSREEAGQMVPFLNLEGVEGALFVPDDGSATASILVRAMIEGAGSRGVGFWPHTAVCGIDVTGGRVRGVETTRGHIKTETLVVAAGIWSPRIARLAGITLPLVPMEHQYAVSGPIPGLQGCTVPNMRDPDRLIYTRQQGDALVLGGYERNPAPFLVETIPGGEHPTVLPFDPARFEPLHQAAIRRMPLMQQVPLARQVNGLESFTLDGEFLLGPAGGVCGFWSACGFCAHGVSGAGGVGQMMAEWIVAGEPSLDLWHMDVRRIGPYAGDTAYVRQRATEVYSTYYDIHYPGQERASARQLRLSPLYEETKRLGAIFGEKAGWERPNWFASNEGRVLVEHPPRGWAAENWSSAIAAEHIGTRERAGLFDVTSFSKLEVSGPGALGLLQRLADNQMDRPPGSVTYTQLLNQRGGIECDLTVTRLAPDRFLLITGAAFGTHDLSWIRQNLPCDGSAQADDITESRCAVGLWGPRARDILQRVTQDDVGNGAFPYMTAREIEIAGCPTLALRVTYVGELGWELYTSNEHGVRLWQALWEAGQEFGAVAAGYRAIESLRLEKGYRYWSTDLTSEYNPYEAGLGFAVRLKKGEFIGREALLEAKERGPRRTLCLLTLADPTAVALGNEPLLDGDRVVGRVTSGGYGYSVRESIVYAYLPIECSAPGTRLDLQWFGERIPAMVRQEPLYDPDNSRVKV